MDAVAQMEKPSEPKELSGRALAARGKARLLDLEGEGEPLVWCLGGALALGIVMILGLLVLVLWNGATTFLPKPIEVVRLSDGTVIAGEPVRTGVWTPGPEVLATLTGEARDRIARSGGTATRTLYRIGNYDLYGEDFRWAAEFQVLYQRPQPPTHRGLGICLHV